MATIREQVLSLIESKGYTIGAVAAAINYSAPTVSMYLSGKYKARAGRIEAALLPWLRREGASTDAVEGGENADIETRTVAAVANACDVALEQGEMTAVIGAPGTGKTHGVKRWTDWARTNRLRCIVVTANVLTNAVALLRELGVALGLRDRTAAQLLNAIVEKLNRDPTMLIIDEAQHLNVKALEAVRAIHDQTMCGVTFVGSLQLSRTLEVGDAASVELAQLQDRIAVIERVDVLNELEISRFVRRSTGLDIVDADAMVEFRTISRGVPRRLIRLLDHTRRLSEGSGKAISAAMVREASKRLVAAA